MCIYIYIPHSKNTLNIIYIYVYSTNLHHLHLFIQWIGKNYSKLRKPGFLHASTIELGTLKTTGQLLSPSELTA